MRNENLLALALLQTPLLNRRTYSQGASLSPGAYCVFASSLTTCSVWLQELQTHQRLGAKKVKSCAYLDGCLFPPQLTVSCRKDINGMTPLP